MTNIEDIHKNACEYKHLPSFDYYNCKNVENAPIAYAMYPAILFAANVLVIMPCAIAAVQWHPVPALLMAGPAIYVDYLFLTTKGAIINTIDSTNFLAEYAIDSILSTIGNSSNYSE